MALPLTTLALLLLATLGAAHDDDDDDNEQQTSCSECNGDDCKVLDTVKVNKLCADELCVGGSSVVVSDGDPCTSDDVIDGVPVHLPIENCCSSSNDCARWAPAPNCITAECVYTEELPSHGWCKFSSVPNCCALDKDCPALPCKNATCVPTELDSLHYSPQHKRFVPLGHGQLDNIPGQCNYTALEDCCLTTRDCVGQCPPGTFGICDKAMDCQCVPSGNPECSKDSDCAADEAAKRVCEEGCEDETKPPCYYYECDRGWCTCVFDPDRDFDNDGVCCKNDCDDRNPDIKDEILCAVGTQEEINFDGDDFYLCGIEVLPQCGAECDNFLPPVQRNQTVEINGVLILTFDCDCCDRNSSGLDQPVTCAKDANANGNNAPPTDCAPQAPDFTCEQCYESLCVLQPESGKVSLNDTEALDELCEDAKGEGYVYYPVPTDPAPSDECDFCDATEDATSRTPTLMCPIEYLVGPTNYTICPKGDPSQEYGPVLLAGCCAYVLSTDSNDPNAHPQLDKFKECCVALEAVSYNATCGSCLDAVMGLFPGSCARCECNNEWETPCNVNQTPDPENPDRNIRCVNDTDGDHYFNCTDVHFACYSPRISGPATDDAACAAVFGASFVSLETAVDSGDISGGNFDNTFCDCNDTLPGAYQMIVCGLDLDGDGFLQSPAPVCQDGVYVPREPVCEQICAAECVAPHVEITPQNCEPADREPPQRRRRNAIEAVKAVAARHGWFDERAVAVAEKKRKRQVADVPPRVDPTCESLACNNLDCCDASGYVYPGSNFGTAALNECGDYDMNCDCMYHSTVACPNAESDAVIEHYYVLADALGAAPDDGDDFSLGIRNLGNGTSPKYTIDAAFTATPDRLGYCGDDCDNMCMDFVTGISLESKFGGPDNRKRHNGPGAYKRAISIELQKSCTELVELRNTDLDANNNVLTLVPGKCFEFIEGCSTPCSAGGECNSDCEICTKLWS